MRALTKIATVSMIAAAALAVSACKKTETTTVDNSATVTDMGNEGMATDNMTTVDTTSNDAGMMANDATVANDTTTTTTNTTTNAM